MSVGQSESIPKTMRAVMCHGPKDYRLEEVPTPEAGAGEVVIKLHACGVCASDMKCYTGARFSGETRTVNLMSMAL